MKMESNIDSSLGENSYELYENLIKTLTGGGITPEGALRIVENCKRRFKEETFYKIVDRELFRYFQKSSARNRVYTDEELEEIAENIISNVWKRFLGSRSESKKTIYSGPGGVDLKEDSLS